MGIPTTNSLRFWREAQHLRQKMNDAYERLASTMRQRPADNEALSQAQAEADALGKRYERLCERICRTEAASFEEVLAKLQCATRCIQDVVPEGTDPEQACDIELRFVFAVERGVRHLLAGALRSNGSRRLGVVHRARSRQLRDGGTIKRAGRAIRIGFDL
jgi:hypothetical protein